MSLTTINLVGDNGEFEVLGIFWGVTPIVVMRDAWGRLNSVSSIGVLPFIEGSLGDCTSGLVASSRDSEEHA